MKGTNPGPLSCYYNNYQDLSPPSGKCSLSSCGALVYAGSQPLTIITGAQGNLLIMLSSFFLTWMDVICLKGQGFARGSLKPLQAAGEPACVLSLLRPRVVSPTPPLSQVTKHASVSSQEVNVALTLLRLLVMSIGMRKEKNPGLFSQLPPPPPTLGASPLPHPSAEASRFGVGAPGHARALVPSRS